MIKTAKFCLKVFLAVTVLVSVIVSALAIRILYSPIDVPYATEMVESEADRLLPGWTVTFDSAEIGWGWSDVRPWIRVANIAIKDPSGKIESTIDDAWLDVSRSDLLVAKFTMRAAKLSGLDLNVMTGGGDNNFWSKVDATKGPKALAVLVDSFFQQVDLLNQGKMSLEELEINALTADILDKSGQQILALNLPSVELSLGEKELNLAVYGFARSGNEKVDIRLKADADILEKKIFVEWDSDPVNFKHFLAAFNPPEYLQYVDAPLALALSLSADASEGLLTSNMYLDIGKGGLSHASAYPEAGELGYFITEVKFDKEHNSFLVTNIDTQLNGHSLKGEALVYFDEGVARPGVKVDVTLASMTIPDLKILWPNIGRGTAKKWVVNNMTTGSMSNAHFLLDVDSSGIGAFHEGSIFDLSFNYRGLDTKYIKSMPIMTNIDGTGHYTRTTLDFRIDSARVEGMTLGTSHYVMKDLHKRGKSYSIANIHLAAPVQDLLRLTAYKPISLNERMKIGSERIRGYAITDTKIEFPNRKGLKAQDIEFSTRVQGSGVEIDDLMKGEGIRKGTIDLTVTKRGLTSEGNIILNGVAMHASWSEDFEKGKIEGEDTTQFTLSGNFDAEDIKAFNIDISSFLNGKVPAEATFTGRKFNITDGHFTVDATPAVINVSQMAWQKEAGRPVIISGSIKFSPEEIRLSPLNAQGPNLDFSGDFYWKLGDDQRFKADLNARQMDINRFNASIERAGLGAYHTNIVAKDIDIRPFLEFQEQEKKHSKSILESATVLLSLKADTAHFMNGVIATNLALETIFTDDGPQETKAKTTFKSGHDVDLAIFVEDNATRNLWFETQDAGAFLSGMGLFAHGRGGKIAYNGQLEHWGRNMVITGEGVGENMKVIPVSMLAEEAKIGVISGIDELVGARGTDFDTLVIPFSYDKGLLDLNGMRASGNSIGLTLEGQIDVFENKINMNGIYIPAYGINSVIGNIPLIGPLLTGGKGQGVFGVTYRVKGMLDSPKVSINPLSGIAPGIFRRIFQGSKGKVSDVETVTPKAETIPETQPNKAEASQGS